MASSKMNITLLGATGGTGQEIANRLLHSPQAAELYSVTLLVRNASRIKFDASNAIVLTGDASVPSDLEKAIATADVVISTLGYPASLQAIFSKITLLTDFSVNFINATAAVSSTRSNSKLLPKLIVVSAMGTGDTISTIPIGLQALYRTVIAQDMKDKAGLEAGLEKYGGELVIVRPALLTDGSGTVTYRVGEAPLNGYSISRKDLAHFIVECISSNVWIGKKPVIVY